MQRSDRNRTKIREQRGSRPSRDEVRSIRNRLWVPLLLLLALTLTALMGVGIRLTLDEQGVVRKRYAFLFYSELESVRERVSDWQRSFEADLSSYAEQISSGRHNAGQIPDLDRRVRKASLSTSRPFAPLGWTQRFNAEGAQSLYSSQSGEGVVVFEIESSALESAFKRCLAHIGDPAGRLLSGRLIEPMGQIIGEWGPPRPGDALDVAGARLPAPFERYQLQGAVPAGFWSKSFYSQALFTVMPSLLLMILVLSGGVAVLLRRHEQEVRDTQDRMTFLNRVSHELKTPLTNIRLYAELLEARLDVSDPRTKHQLDVILSESHRLSRFITSVLTFAKSERKELQVSFVAGYPMETIQSVVDAFRPILSTEEIRVSLRTGRDGFRSFDPDAVMHIVGNLLTNVHQYAFAGGQVAVGGRLIGTTVFLRVSDRGPGIPPALVDRIFEPFVRGESPPKGSHASTGLGLSIARELARLHGGDLRTVRVATGAVFLLRLNTHHERTELGEVSYESACL